LTRKTQQIIPHNYTKNLLFFSYTEGELSKITQPLMTSCELLLKT